MTNGPILFVDTETTGLLVQGMPVDDPSQPHLAQLAMLLTNPAGHRVGQFVAYVRPDGWEMPAAASAINGLTTDYLAAYGLPLVDVWGAFRSFSTRAELIVAHNVDFDRTVIEIATVRLGGQWDWKRPWFCTKEASAPVCCLPGRSGYPPRAKEGRYKWPTLNEAHCFLCGGPVANAHDALADAEACARVYFALLERAGAASNAASPEATQ